MHRYIINRENEVQFFKAILTSNYPLLNALKRSRSLAGMINCIERETRLTPLMFACFQKDLNMVNYLLTIPEVDINVQNPDGLSALIQAAISGDERIVNRLLEEPNINLIRDGHDAAYFLQQKNRLDLAARLLALIPEEIPVVVTPSEPIKKVSSNQDVTKEPSFEDRLNAINYNGTIPDEYLCPISKELMNDPITLSNGITYDRTSLATYFKTENKITISCPMTKKPINIEELDFGTNIVLKKLIAHFIEKQEKKIAKNNNNLEAKQENIVVENNEQVRAARLRLFERRNESETNNSEDSAPKKDATMSF